MIWAGTAPDKTGVAVAFRRKFDLPAAPKVAAIHVFADARYVLWVNGKYVERGPNRFQPSGPEYDTVHIEPRLKPGKNTLAVLVVGNLSGGKLMRHLPGLTAMLEVDGKELLYTDSKWKYSDATRFRSVDASWANLGDTVVDTRIEDGDWTREGYSDINWKPAVPIEGRQWGPLTARRIPLLREKDVAVKFAHGRKLPVALNAGEKLEFTTGRIVQAYPVVELNQRRTRNSRSSRSACGTSRRPVRRDILRSTPVASWAARSPSNGAKRRSPTFVSSNASIRSTVPARSRATTST